ncbi:hypothetical protein HBB16_20390 [Pseudonocardia sp. MCCB 268]|nr:hypothetical protein [Pseudonocardia cytotoxica]
MPCNGPMAWSGPRLAARRPGRTAALGRTGRTGSGTPGGCGLREDRRRRFRSREPPTSGTSRSPHRAAGPPR